MSIPHGLSKEGIAKDWKSYIKLAGTKENTVYIMFRLTNLVILFAVVVCAMAFPGPPADPVPLGTARTSETGAPKQPVHASEGNAKGDLDTDAQTYLAYNYYGPGLGYYNPGFVRSYPLGLTRTYGYGPYIAY